MLRKGNTFFKTVLVLGIFSLYIWVIHTSLNPGLPKPDSPALLYSNQSRQDLRTTLLSAIKDAKKSIHLVMFGLTDPAILSAIIEKSKEIDVTVYYDPSASLKVASLLSTINAHPVKNRGLMHQKILVVDEELVLLGSANMTQSSLSMHDNLMIGLNNQKLAKFLKQKTPISSGNLKCYTGGQTIEIWLLPEPRGHALNDLKKMIRSSRKSIRIAMFTFTHMGLVEEIIKAKKRGVNVSVVVDMNSGIGVSAKCIEVLKASRVDIQLSQGSQLLHHKFIYIDENILVTGSSNWTKAAFYRNHDCFLILRHLNKDQKKFMNQLWEYIQAEASAA